MPIKLYDLQLYLEKQKNEMVWLRSVYFDKKYDMAWHTHFIVCIEDLLWPIDWKLRSLQRPSGGICLIYENSFSSVRQ